MFFNNIPNNAKVTVNTRAGISVSKYWLITAILIDNHRITNILVNT